uniref:Hydroperoxide isomerase ALOXE3-like n=1 Tax=Seriola dumerili TaxID=41447 RepID=A0A3B4V2F7_SERDU
MAEYKLEVTTGEMPYAGTWDHVFVTLFGNEGQSERIELDNYGPDFTRAAVRTYTIKTSSSLGKLLLVKVEKDPYLVLSEDAWYCSKLVVTTPEEDVILFPCYRWISRGELVELRGGRVCTYALRQFQCFSITLFVCFYRWKIMAEGLPHINSFNNESELPDEIRYSDSKSNETLNTEMIMWINILDILSYLPIAFLPEYVTEHWKEDDFYGYQFLNGINPNVIKKCSELPPNFPVTEEMVKPFLEEDSSLEEEMEDGKIFLYDQKKMDGIPARDYNGEPLHVSAGLCLFYLNPEDKLMPIAIQLHQQPSEDNPIFLPSDSETDWLLAKMFIKNADFIDHEAVHHLMSTHFLAEVYTMAALRCFPVIHPLYKLLIPHFRYTIYINTEGRESLFGKNGVLRISSLGYDGMMELMRRALSEMTYSSLCLPENITARGLESIPNFYYRDDGLKLWNIINSFVTAIVEYYYPSNSEVQKDTELQEWINEIFTHAFLRNTASGFPGCFHTVEEVIKFITMVIFTVTAQHAAVNNGQFDYNSWVPNGSLLLHQPPPTTKGESSMETILETLPNVGESYNPYSLTMWPLPQNTVPLGAYPEERFDEPAPKQMIKDFQEELSYLSEEITSRNSELKVPYTYLNPTEIENSITI